MAEDSDLEKTEAPSERRLEQAREKGQVPHSKELGTFFGFNYRCCHFVDDGRMVCAPIY